MSRDNWCQEGIWKVWKGVSKTFRGCLIVVLKVSGRCPEGVWKIWKEPGRCLENKKIFQTKNLLEFFSRPNIFNLKLLLETNFFQDAIFFN